MENFLKEAQICGALKALVPEIMECDFQTDPVKTDNFGYVIANVKHNHLKKIVITKEYVFHLMLVQKLSDFYVALYAVYLNI